VCKLTIWPIGAEPQKVVEARLFIVGLVTMPKLAVNATHLAETALVIRTLLLLLGGAGLGFFWMSVYTLGVLLVAVAIFFEELTDWNFVFTIHMQVLAVVALSTRLFQPMHAHFLLQLRQVRSRQVRIDE